MWRRLCGGACRRGLIFCCRPPFSLSPPLAPQTFLLFLARPKGRRSTSHALPAGGPDGCVAERCGLAVGCLLTNNPKVVHPHSRGWLSIYPFSLCVASQSGERAFSLSSFEVGTAGQWLARIIIHPQHSALRVHNK